MTRKTSAAKSDHAIKLYLSGKLVGEVASEVGISPDTVRRILRDGNVKTRSASESYRIWGARRDNAVVKKIAAKARASRACAKACAKIDIDDIVKRYLSGESSPKIAASYGVDSEAIRTRLVKAGIDLRSHSTYMRMRWANASREERASMIAPAHVATRGRPRDEAAMIAAATTRFLRQTHIGSREKEFAADFASRGLSFLQQCPIGPYNVDFAFYKQLVAVEIETGNWGGPRPAGQYAKRLEYILDKGWSVLFVYYASVKPSFPKVTDKIIEFRDLIGRDKASSGKYGMIRGDGQSAFTVCVDFDRFPRVEGF